MYRFLILLAYLSAGPAIVIGPMILAAWLSDRLHEFGPWDPRYLLLVQGSNAARLDLVEPIAGSVRYAARGEEGTAPAQIFVEFNTTASPEAVIDTYETRCTALGLTPRRMPQTDNELQLHCTGETSDLGIVARRMGSSTAVTVGGWDF
jgi:hypothetical protein